MKRVFVMSTVHKWNDSRIFYKECKSLSKVYSVELHAISNFKYDEKYGIKIYGLPQYNKRILRFINWGRLLGRILRSDAEVYHFHDPELIPIGLLIKLFRKGKVIYDVHEDYEEGILNKNWIPKLFRSNLSRIYSKFEKYCARKFDSNINVIEFIGDKFISRGAKVDIIKNYPIKVTNEREIDVFDNNTINVIYVGSITKLRGIYEMVDSMNYVNNLNVNMILAGPCETSEIKEYILSKTKTDHRITYAGNIDHDKIFDLLSKCDIGLVCLHKVNQYANSLPLKLFEYMAARLPIVATAMPYWVNEYRNFNCIEFIENVTSNDIANAVIKLVNNRELAKEMADSAYKAYINNFTWEREEKKLLKLYERILD